jgi:hypothetical protein
MHKLKHCAVLALAGAGFAGAAHADTSDVTWQSRVAVEKSGTQCADDPHCFNRYHPARPWRGPSRATTSCSGPAMRSTAT